jgi:dynein heavy chain
VTICVDMQERAMKLTNRYREELRRYYYVTPTSYLILIKTFTNLLNKRRKQVNDEINKFDRGLFQLGNAEKQVGELRANLEILIPQCKQAAEESQEKQKEIELQRKEVEKEKKIAGEQAALAKEEKDKATLIKEDCDRALEKVMPIYNKAMKAVSQLKASDVTEMKGTKSPSAGLLLVAQVLCLIFNVKPKVIRAQTAKE